MQAISLFSGAGGMDVGFKKAGFETLWANDFDEVACETYAENNLGHIVAGDINQHLHELRQFEGIDVLFGGPPCQGFSVAGKMNPEDERSMLVWSFVEAIKIVKPRAFVMENVKALAALSRWEDLRHKLISAFAELGYSLSMRVLNATEYGVPQKRERMFLVGLRDGHISNFDSALHQHKKKAPTVRHALKHLDSAGTGNNQRVCNAEITLASNPILRKSPYAGMIFNGAGRPIHIDGYALTLPASMGGNKTPIIDNLLLATASAEDWVVKYHTHLMAGGAPYSWKEVPSHLRRITVDEALALQTFPASFKLAGGKSAAYRMIGNAVPCNLAYAVAQTVKSYLQHEQDAIPAVYSQRHSALQPELVF